MFINIFYVCFFLQGNDRKRIEKVDGKKGNGEKERHDTDGVSITS